MKFKLIALSLCMIASANVVKGQEYGKDVSTTENKHEIRLSVSDGLTLGSADILGIGLSDAITGSKRTNQSNSMVYGIGYRYALNRFRLGGDLGFAQSSSQLTLSGEKTPSIKEKELNFLILPTAEFVLLQTQTCRTLRNSRSRCKPGTPHRKRPFGSRQGSSTSNRPVNFFRLSDQPDCPSRRQ